jgi:hypothetical protein
MLCKKVNKLTITLSDSSNYELNEPYDIDETFSYVAVSEGLDADCVLPVLENEVIILVEDITLNKNKRIAALNIQTWATVMAQAKIVYGSDEPILVLAAHAMFQDMVSHPANYVGDIFIDNAAVLAYAEPKLDASSAYGKWRFGILAQEQISKAAILAE